MKVVPEAEISPKVKKRANRRIIISNQNDEVSKKNLDKQDYFGSPQSPQEVRLRSMNLDGTATYNKTQFNEVVWNRQLNKQMHSSNIGKW